MEVVNYSPSFCPFFKHHGQYEWPPYLQRGMNPLQPHDVWQFAWSHHAEELNISL